MKIFPYLAIAALAGAAVFGGCTEEINLSDEYPYYEELGSVAENPQDSASILTKLAKGEVSMSFTFEGVTLFQSDARTNFEWEQVDLSDYFGFDISLPRTIHITDGCTWQEYSLFNVALGPNPLYMPWEIYCSRTGHSNQLFIVSNMGYDEESQQMTIGDKICRVESLVDDTITLSHESQYSYWDNSGNAVAKGTHKEFLEYKIVELNIEDKDSVLYFASEKELFRALIDTLREYFGNEFNMNDYLYPTVILTSPMVNFDEIEKQLLGE